jgi:hypothetical protein
LEEEKREGIRGRSRDKREMRNVMEKRRDDNETNNTKKREYEAKLEEDEKNAQKVADKENEKHRK